MNYWKKIIGCVLAGLLLQFSLLSVSAESRATLQEGNFGYQVVSGSAEITAYYSSGATEIQIPATLGGYPVTAIGEKAFQNQTKLKKITFSEGITVIGDWAFLACSSLQSVALPQSLQKIGEMAFGNCYALTSVSLPKNVSFIGPTAFANCTSLRSISIAGDNPHYTVQDNVIFNKNKTKLIFYPHSKTEAEYTVPAGVTEIGEKALEGCAQLKKINLPASLVKIEKYAFSGCTGLTSVTLSDAVTTIGFRAFYGCSNLKSVVISDRVTTLETDAFQFSNITAVRFYSTAQKNKFAALFPSASVTCQCKSSHNFVYGSKLVCTVCGYERDFHAPPVLVSKTHDTVTLETIPGFEYSRDKTNWQKSPVFSGLSPNQTYQFYCRLAASGGTAAGPVSNALTVTTDKLSQSESSSPPIPSSPSGSTPPDSQQLTSSVYTIDGEAIRKIPAETTVTKLLSGINGGDQCAVYKGSAQQGSSAVVGTGMTVKWMSGSTVKATYTLIVTGDTNGDGQITVTDMIAIKAHILGKSKLSGVNATAGDTNGDGSISITDFIQVKAKILGKGNIVAR